MVSPTNVQELPENAQKLLARPGVSDGSELVPAEANRPETVDITGYTTDREGLINNYAVTPDIYVQERSRFGFTPMAERLNGRLAMIGFVALLLTELLSGQSFVALF